MIESPQNEEKIAAFAHAMLGTFGDRALDLAKDQCLLEADPQVTAVWMSIVERLQMARTSR